MLLLFLLFGLGVGAIIVLVLARVLGARTSDAKWRGYLYAVGAGIALSALFDLIPPALDFLTLLVRTLLDSQVAPRLTASVDSPLGLILILLSELVRPFGAVGLLFLYLSGNSLPMRVGDKYVGLPPMGWRSQLIIPAVGEMDARGVALLTIGLAAQNLWLGQVRGALLDPSNFAAATTNSMFLVSISIVAVLRGIALFGSLTRAASRGWLTLGLTLGIALPAVYGVMVPSSRSTIVLGVVPLWLAVILVPIELGRMMRVMSQDIGLGWRTTTVVLGTLAVVQGIGRALLLLAQGIY